MLFRKCILAAVLTVAIATASFALVASDGSFGIADSPNPVAKEASSANTDSPPLLLDPGCDYCPGVVDCNGNCEDDRCDLDCGDAGTFCPGGYGIPAIDHCNAGNFPHCGQSADCNNNNVPDECDQPDCNDNEIPDECELAGNDCNENEVPDDCEPAGFCCGDGDCSQWQCCGHTTPYTCGGCRW